MVHKTSLSGYNNVFCDSLEALEYAYQQGLSRDAIIRTSSPAMLWNKDPNIIHVESHWNVDLMKEFQSTIQRFSEEIYDNVMLVEGISREESLCIAQAAVSFHRLLFKAACLTRRDLVEPCLFISVDGNGGPGGNNMNPPWDKLLINNPKYKTITYVLKNDKWSTLTTAGVSLWNRMRIGGMETLTYRLFIKLTNKLPISLFRRQVLITNENELLIETAAHLALNGVRIREINPIKKDYAPIDKNKLLCIKKSIKTLVNIRIKNWVDPNLVKLCESLLFQEVEEKLNSFMRFRSQWEFIAKEPKQLKRVLLINSPVNTKGLAIASVCRKSGIPIVSFQHGVTYEICATHGEMSVNCEINASDLFVAYNCQSEKKYQTSHFIYGDSFVAGISARHLRMNRPYYMKSNNESPIIYVSTNLYRGNIGAFSTWETDYDRAVNEHLLVTKVLGRLPHKVCYKNYPEDNRRYADKDPVLMEVCAQENMDLFSRKIDMRYLLSKHRVLVTTVATSTLSWLVMSGKPVVFINQIHNGPLTKNAHSIFSKGLFLFDNTEGFHERLRNFLSLPIAEIEKLWTQKKGAREKMVKQFFTSSLCNNSGKIASGVINDKYFK